jgi:hypothetical protein
LVRRRADGAIVRRAGDVVVGDSLAIRLAEVELDASVETIRKLSTD